ncbi:MAG: glycoside hydrolase family 3 C-terminal domain-containing protein [Bacteroidales bacterium]
MMPFKFCFNLEIKILSLFLIGLSFSCNQAEKYKDLNLSFESRAGDLVSKMTLDEKISQMTNNSPAIPRLGIPEYNWWNECLHGVGRAGIATVFPQAIGLASMWDDSTMFQIATAVSDEARAKYHNYIKKEKRGIYHGLTFWTPNINIFRDPRWGRGMETYGEDPFLTGELAVAYIKGLQGNDPKYFKLIATAKHFVVHSGPEYARHSFDVAPSAYDFLETYSPHFKKVIQKAKVYSVMCAYNSYNGMPCCGNSELSDLLRKDWGFKGYIVSDCGAVKDFYLENGHEIVNTKAEAASIAVKAGTDLNCGDSYQALKEAVDKGYITESEIDISLKRLIIARMKLGMFDPDEKVPYTSIPYSVVDAGLHKKMALEAARKSIVLLKNEGNLLPFSKKVKRVAVIGPNANDLDVLMGNYNGYPSAPKTPFQGIKEKLPGALVKYAPGCRLSDELPVFSTIPAKNLFVNDKKEINGLKGEYFNNTALEGDPEMVRVDTVIDFKWWTNGPGAQISGDYFSVRWTGVLIPETSGNYAIGMDGFPEYRLWIDGKEWLNYTSIHHPLKQYEFIHLEAGKTYHIRLEYIQNNSDYASIQLIWEQHGKKMREEAIRLAKQSDLIVLCMGLSPLLEGEEMNVKVKGFTQGDRDDIKLPEIQTDLIKTIFNLQKPTVLVLLNGSALAFNWEAENIPAIMEAWYPGQDGGTAIADVIFGDYNPSGRLPVTFYKSVEQLPDFDDYNMEGRTYRYFKGEPLYEFGHGLSYTTFKYDNLKLPQIYTAGEDLKISVEVKNTGLLFGEEVIQLYISHPASEYKLPIRALKGFKRIGLLPGESKTVNFTLNPEDIAVLDKDLRYIIPPENITISVGGRQPGKKSLETGEVLTGKIKVKVQGQKYYIVK